MNVSQTDCVVKRIRLRAPRARVWRALTNAQEIGSWFGVSLDPGVVFAPGARIHGMNVTPGYEHLPWDVTIECMEPERLLSWRWHPHAPADPGRDYTGDPTTLVAFELEAAGDETLLTVTESGFDNLPAEVREQTYRGNEAGWEYQMQTNLTRYVATA